MSTAKTSPDGVAQLAETPSTPYSVPISSRRLTSASAAALELHQHWGAWSAGLGKFALQASFALMAANWAIHGSNHSGILANAWAKWSMTVGFLYLTSLLILIGRHVLLVRRRRIYADFDRARWQSEFEEASANAGTPWPYSSAIERNGDVMLWLHFLAPLLMGCLLLTSVFLSTSPVPAERVGKTATLRAASAPAATPAASSVLSVTTPSSAPR